MSLCGDSQLYGILEATQTQIRPSTLLIVITITVK